MLIISFMISSCDFAMNPTKQDITKSLGKVSTPKKKAIIILNGLWQPIQCFDVTVQKLREASRAQRLGIEIACLEERETSCQSIAQQAEKLAKVLLERGMGKDNYDLILLGHSQGGLKGYELYKEFGGQFCIKGLITTATPWEGAPAAAITKETVKAYLNGPVMYCCLTGAKYLYPSSEQLTTGLLDVIFDRYFPTHEPGVQDLVPNSEFLQNIAASLINNQAPILAIAGSNGDVESILPHNANHTRYIHMLPRGTFNALYARVFAGGMQKKHDMIVPVDSQLAQNTHKSHAFVIHTIPDAIHDCLPGLEVPPDKVIYNHPEAIEAIVAFAKEQFELE